MEQELVVASIADREHAKYAAAAICREYTEKGVIPFSVTALMEIIAPHVAERVAEINAMKAQALASSGSPGRDAGCQDYPLDSKVSREQTSGIGGAPITRRCVEWMLIALWPSGLGYSVSEGITSPYWSLPSGVSWTTGGGRW